MIGKGETGVKKLWVAVVKGPLPDTDLYASGNKAKVLKWAKKLAPSLGKNNKVLVVKKAA